ncbi:putative E3 ubiquitin-protein ligase HUL4 [Nakaseomyces bracarensis]|uniref:HECT-type E3 ubiquitin transferase n=1 Tax=Nakaseomyces bracarensis TaxID=273131 RepID=A0ABR4NUI6_9SACH
MFRRSLSLKKKNKEDKDKVKEIEIISYQTVKKEARKKNLNQSQEKEITTKGNDRVKCLCCGALLDIPVQTRKFKCSVCHVTTYRDNDMLVSNIEGLVCTGERLNKIIRGCYRMIMENKGSMTQEEKYNAFNPVNDFIDLYFNDYRILERSFKVNNYRYDIDFDEVARFYGMLLKLPTRRPYFRLLCTMNGLLRKRNQDMQEFRWLFIILSNPALRSCLVGKAKGGFDSEEIRAISYELIKKCIGLLANLSSTKASKEMIRFLTIIPSHTFLNQLEGLNLYLTFQFSKILFSNQQMALEKVQPSRIHSDGLNIINDNHYWSQRNLRSIESPNINGVLENKESEHGKKGTPTGSFKFSPYQYDGDWHITTVTRLLSYYFMSNGKRDAFNLNHDTQKTLEASNFYNTILDFIDYRKDFDNWRGLKKNIALLKKSKEWSADKKQFSFCSFPFLLSLGLKISIMEYEIRRIMEHEAEVAFLSSLDDGKAVDVYLKISVRRTHITGDSLRCIKEHHGDLFKSLKVEFIGEPGVDAGGLRKEWFLLLTKSLYDPNNSLFVYVPESRLIWFSNNSHEEMSNENINELYYLFGVVMGLAIFNSTILNLHFPIAIYKKLCGEPLTFKDYAELYPETAQNLQKLLEYEHNDIEDVFALTFETTFIDDGWELKAERTKTKYKTVELCDRGSYKSVTKANRKEYVELWVDFYLTTVIEKQFSHFAKGFKKVFSISKSIKLFNAEELKRLVCGDVDSNKYDFNMLRSVTRYIGGLRDDMTVSQWFWELVEEWNYPLQRKLMRFVTGSDGVPATGMSTMPFKISLLGSTDSDKLPIAHTCFNELCLWQYDTKEKLEKKLTWAITESEGFGFK